MRNTSLIEYALIGLIAVCLVGLLSLALTPVADGFAQTGKAIGSALAGTK